MFGYVYLRRDAEKKIPPQYNSIRRPSKLPIELALIDSTIAAIRPMFATAALMRMGAMTRSISAARFGPFCIMITMITFAVMLFKGDSDNRWARENDIWELTHQKLAELNLTVSENESSAGHRHLRLFMPADGPSINLCKVVHSGVALGYPMPTLLNWNGEFNRPDWHFAGSHIAKLESLLAALDALYEEDPAANNDIALLVDAYDVWFQLPPSALLQRFHKANIEADTRVRKSWMDSGYDSHFPVPPPRQEIIITAAKDCQPGVESGSSPNYLHWPDSPMPRDLYGEDSDKIDFSADSARRYRKVRPRCVNSGMIMGKVGPLRAALRRCKEKVEAVSKKGRQLWSDQALIAEVIGEQEMWREWVRTVLPTFNQQPTNRPRNLSKEVRKVAEAALDGQRFEFGIGLDYISSTMPPTCSAEDGSFVRWADREALQKASEKAGVPGNVRVPDVPTDLGGSESPLPGAGLSWAEVPLYTDFFFGNAPVALHHNAYIWGLKAWRLSHWWNMTWFYPHLRDLVTIQLQQGKPLPLAKIPPGTARETDIVYWAPPEEAGEKTIKSFKWSNKGVEVAVVGWDGICKRGQEKWHETIFGDGKGPLPI